MPRFFCRMHGEVLLRDEVCAWWRCPEFAVCGTFVTDEFVARRSSPMTWLRQRAFS